MRTKSIISIAALIGVAAILVIWLRNQRPTAGNPSEINHLGHVETASPSPIETAWEYKTVDEEMSGADVQRNMQQWNEEGWAVLSISGPLRQADGTVHRKASLRREKR